MKKVFVLIAIAIVCLSASSQVQFGVKVGVDATNFWGKTAIVPPGTAYPWTVNHKMRLNYQAGLVMECWLSHKFAIAPEVVFAAQGGKCTSENPALSHQQREVTFTTNYINIPVILKYYLSPAFSIDLGPQLGFNVYSSAKTDLGDLGDKKDYTKNVDFGIGLGGTYNLTDHAFIQARYTMGLTKVFNDECNEAKNGNIQLAFGMKF